MNKRDGKKKKGHPSNRPQNPSLGRGKKSADTNENFDAELGGKKIYTDVYTIGKENISFMRQRQTRFGAAAISPKEKNQQKTRLPSGGLNSPLMSCEEFLREYKKAFPDGENPKGETTVRSVRGKKEKPNEKASDPRRGKNVGSEPGSRGKSIGLRIIGGKFKALKLEYSGDHRVRPMKDRIREALFNLMGTLAKGKHVVDLFAGTGALAFEALSRGAESATCIEVHFPTARVLKKNIGHLEEKESGISRKVELKTTDAFFWGRNPLSFQSLPQDLPWLIFCSPPYDFYVDRKEEMLQLLATLYQAAPLDSVFAVEADERFDFDLLNVEIPPKKRRSYAPAEIAVYMK